MSVSKQRGKWVARVMCADGKRRNRSFTLKADAQRWEREELRKAERGELPSTSTRTKITVGEVAESWLSSLDGRGLKPKTIDGYHRVYSRLVEPRWGRVKPMHVRSVDVRDWVARLTGDKGQALSRSRRKQGLQVLAMILDEVQAQGHLSFNPAREPIVRKGIGGKGAGAPGREHPVLTATQLANLAACAGDQSVLVEFLGLTGLRFGEAAALTVGDIDGRTVHVSKSVAEINGALITGTTKTGATRTIVMPSGLTMSVRGICSGKEESDFLFTTKEGRPLRRSNWYRRIWHPALEAAGLPKMRIHDLRGTAASLAIQAGANIKGVQEMLGHSSAAMTLDVYAQLFDSHRTEVAERLDALLAHEGWQQSGNTSTVRTLQERTI